MPKSLITETLYEVPKYYFGKRKFYKCKEKVLNFIQTLTNEKKVIYKSPNGIPYLFAFPQGNGAHVQISWHYQSCLQNTNANGELLDMPRYSIVIVHYKLATTVSGHTIPNNSAFSFCRHDWYCSPTLSSEKQIKDDLKVHFNRNMSSNSLSHQAHVPLNPSQRDANAIFYPLLYWFLFYMKNFHMSNSQVLSSLFRARQLL